MPRRTPALEVHEDVYDREIDHVRPDAVRTLVRRGWHGILVEPTEDLQAHRHESVEPCDSRYERVERIKLIGDISRVNPVRVTRDQAIGTQADHKRATPEGPPRERRPGGQRNGVTVTQERGHILAGMSHSMGRLKARRNGEVTREHAIERGSRANPTAIRVAGAVTSVEPRRKALRNSAQVRQACRVASVVTDVEDVHSLLTCRHGETKGYLDDAGARLESQIAKLSTA